MASDVTMSSEGSTASRLRQFGLYKSIDSQTAEFLELSRKRQIRRGCACAAVSTAITVTVVVCVLLIYEYGFRRDYKMAPNTLRKFNWIKSVNESNATFNKTTPVKNNGKLLAVILKALDQKRYLETFVEEQSSQKPDHESTTDCAYQKNVFADINRKVPSKMYEGYKSTSHELFKTRRKDSLAKARQITDYQRVITYLNTMSLNQRPGDNIHTYVSSSTEPNFKETPEIDVLRNSKYQTVNAKRSDTREESYKRYCNCPQHSTLAEILEKLYNSIQNLRPKAIPRTENNSINCNICDRHKTKTNNTVTVQQSKHYSNNQTESVSVSIQHTTVQISPILNTTTFTQSPVPTMKSTTNSKSIQNEITTTTTRNKNKYSNHNDISHALPSSFVEEMPWKLDFENAAYDDADGIYEHTGIKPAENPTSESDAFAKHSQVDEQEDFDEKYYNAVPEFAEIAHGPTTGDYKRTATEGYISVAKYLDEISEKLRKVSIPPFEEYLRRKTTIPPPVEYLRTKTTEKYYNAVPKFAEIAYEPKTDDYKRTTTEGYISAAKYFDEISQKLRKVSIRPFEEYLIRKTTIPPSVEYLTRKTTYPPSVDYVTNIQLNTNFSSFRGLDLVKNESAYTAKSIENKEMQNKSQLASMPPSNDTVVERILGSLIKQKGRTQYFKPPKLMLVKFTPKKEREKIPLDPMLQSYLLSNKDSEILNLGANTTSQPIEPQSLNSEELPFDLKFASDEEDEEYRLLNDLHTVKVTTRGQRCHRNNHDSESKNCQGREKNKEMILSLSQIWAPKMYLESRLETSSRKPSTVVPKSSTEAPRNTGHKKSKIKEILYMTGGELPAEDFDDNLKGLMYYDKSPVNYTALANTYIKKIESDSIELPKSMLPESRPSLLEIRRNHENVDYRTPLYTSSSDEQI